MRCAAWAVAATALLALASCERRTDTDFEFEDAPVSAAAAACLACLADLCQSRRLKDFDMSYLRPLPRTSRISLLLYLSIYVAYATCQLINYPNI